jgi:hypothetical protein
MPKNESRPKELVPESLNGPPGKPPVYEFPLIEICPETLMILILKIKITRILLILNFSSKLGRP